MRSTSRMFKTLFCGKILLLGFTQVGQAGAQTWTQLSPIGGPPAARSSHSAVFNSTNNRMIVFGGYNGSLLNDVWVLANADGSGGPSIWTQLSPTGAPPSARAYHSAVYDAVNNRMTVFAGDPNIGNCFGAVNDVWVLTNADGTGGTPNWTQLSPTGGPPELRQSPRAVYDSATNRMVVFGGNNNACVPYNNSEVWVLNNANGLGGTPVWTQLAPVGGPPAPRQRNSAVYDSANNRMVVFAGGTDTGLVNDVWALENANGLSGTPAWAQLSPTGVPPSARNTHTAVYDPATNRMVVFGEQGPSADNDVYALENANGLGGTPNWAQLSPTGVPPSARESHTAVYDPATNRMVVFGGDSTGFLNDVWVLTDANGIGEITVTVDIKPSFPNSINPRSRGKIPVAILTTDTFDAATVDPNTVLFGLTGTEAVPVHSALEDVDGDGDTDMILHFNTQATGIQCGDTSASLTGVTLDGQMIQGSDAINTVGCK